MTRRALTDVNVYLGEWPFRRLPCRTPRRLVAEMDRWGVKRAWVSSLDAVFRSEYLDCYEELVRRVRQVGPVGRRLQPALTLDPSYPGWEEDLAGALSIAKPVAVRLHPNYHGYALTDPPALELLRRATKVNLPVLVAARLQDERLHHPACQVPAVPVKQIIEAKRRVRGLRLIATMVRAAEAETLLGTRGISCDISGCQQRAVVGKLTARFGTERVLFGSGYPLQYLHTAMRVAQDATLTTIRGS